MVLEMTGCEIDRWAGRLGHAAALGHGEDNVKVPQPDAAADPICPIHPLAP